MVASLGSSPAGGALAADDIVLNKTIVPESTHASTGHTVIEAETDRLIKHIQSAIDDMLPQMPSAEVVILGDFDAHNASWLESRTIDRREGCIRP